jgi:trigger factor
VKEIVSKNYEQETEYFFHHKVKEKLLEKTKIVLPNVFLKKWLLKTNEKMTEAALATEYEMYASELKWSLIRNKISKDNNLKVEHPEVAEEAKKMIIQQFGGPAVAAQFGEHLDKFADNYLKAENGDNYMKVFNQVQNQKVMKFITEAITTKDKEVSLDDFRKLE